MKHKCPYCNVELEETCDGEWTCPICGEVFVDDYADSPALDSELFSDEDFDEEDDE